MVGRMRDEIPGQIPQGLWPPGERLQAGRDHDPGDADRVAVIERQLESPVNAIDPIDPSPVEIRGRVLAEPVAVLEELLQVDRLREAGAGALLISVDRQGKRRVGDVR